MNYLFQYILPHHALTWLVGKVAHCRWRWWKNLAIKYYIKTYHIDLHAAQLENIEDYPTLNSFFIRQLKPELRPIVQGENQIASPVDGCVSQLGDIEQESLFQAKGFHYTLAALFGGQTAYATLFQQGKFATLYLAPKDYHRIHMPLRGQLQATIYVPGRLFSVNRQSVLSVPHLFSRNERLICIFDTAIGPMAVILIGAMIVGSIYTTWARESHPRQPCTQLYSNVTLERGAELGQFHMGSTVILLFGKQVMEWATNLQADSLIKMGQLIGTTHSHTERP